MLSNVDLERLIAAKKREILMEKSVLGLSPPPPPRASLESDKENTPPAAPQFAVEDRRVKFDDRRPEDRSTAANDKGVKFEKQEHDSRPTAQEGTKVRKEEPIPADLERYIRRYIGLPMMLKAGEYSPNNPLLRGDTPRDRDAFIGLGDYEHRSKTLRRLRQQEYRQYLDEQSKKKQEERAKAESEALERERREREREERLRDRDSEHKRLEQERQHYHAARIEKNSKLFQGGDYGALDSVDRQPSYYSSGAKMDAGVQIGRTTRPLSVAVQTDPADINPPNHLDTLHQPERELSPRTCTKPAPPDERPVTRPAYLPIPRGRTRSCNDRPIPRSVETPHAFEDNHLGDQQSQDLGDKMHNKDVRHRPGPEPAPRVVSKSVDERPIHPALWINESRRRSYGNHDERTCSLSPNANHNKPATKPRHYMPSIFDEDAIVRRNDQAEQEAAERRSCYQKELMNQIEEQARIKEERKAREKMLEMAEMRRLEQQLQMLRLAQDKESTKTEQIACAMRENAKQYESKRTALQKEIEADQKTFLRAITQPTHLVRSIHTAHSEKAFPTSCKLSDLDKIDRKPFSTNIADNSIFSPSYDLDNYLRLNLNPSKESLMSNKMESGYNKVSYSSTSKGSREESEKTRFSFGPDLEEESGDARQIVVEKALVHEEPKASRLARPDVEKATESDVNKNPAKSTYEPSFLKKDIESLIERSPMDVIPVLRHSPKVLSDDDKLVEAQNRSDAMKRLEGKWAIPAVQKNILKTLPSGDGKNVNILTQLGSIRRQLQMEQLKLDKMLSKD